ncbi:uncharacterized protein ACNLHF_027116 [Anomaloglossus baeobatrachus]
MERLIIQQPTLLAKTVFIQSVSEFGKRVQWEHEDSWEFFRTRKEKKPTRRSRSRRHLGDDTEISAILPNSSIFLYNTLQYPSLSMITVMYLILSGLQLSPLHVRLVCGHFLLYVLKAIPALNSATDGHILGRWRAEGKYPPHQCLKPPPPHERSPQEPLSDGVYLHVLLQPPKRLCDPHEYIKIKAGNLFHWNTCTQIPSSQRKSNLLLDFILWKILYHKLFLVVLLPSCSIIFFSSETALLWSDYT